MSLIVLVQFINECHTATYGIVIKRGQQVRLEFHQQWLPMGISLGQSLSLSALSVSFSSGLSPSICSALSSCLLYLRLLFLACLRCSSCSALSCCLLNLTLLFLVCLLACSPFSCLLELSLVFLREILFCFNRIHGKVFCCSEI